jgi:hypothetical protein
MKHELTMTIDDAGLRGYTDKYLATAWSAVQHSHAEFGDALMCDLAEHIGREIIRRWLGATEPELWAVQGRHHPQKWLMELATYQPGEGYDPHGGINNPDNTRAFHQGRWVAKDPDADGDS